MKFTTREQIISSPLTPFDKGRLLDELNQQPQPPAAEPVATADQLRELKDFRARLQAARDALAQLDASERKHEEQLPVFRAQIESLASSVQADIGDDTQIMKLLVAEKRLAVALEFLGNASQRRSVLGRDTQTLFYPLNLLLNQVKPTLATRAFFRGGEISNQIALALDEIKILLP